MNAAPRKVAVIGAGWAGCAAAVELSRSGHTVTLFEAARTLGGRARAVEINGKILDNGQHILLGAYSATLRLMRAVGIKPKDALLRLPLQMRYPAGPDGMDFIAPKLPAPLHLLGALWRATGLNKDDKLALARFSTSARWMGWQLHQDCSVSELLERFDQTARLTKLMWRPLCIAALNTPPERASAQVFLNVLRDSLGARRAASDMLIPRINLSRLLPQQAAALVERHGGSVRTGCAVRAIQQHQSGWHVHAGADTDTPEYFDGLVVATQADHAATLLDGLLELPRFTYEPITTCYLQYKSTVQLSQAFFALLDDPASGYWGQFVFDRGQLDAAQAGLLAVVVSASTEAIADGHAALSAAITQQLAAAFKRPELAQPEWTKVISEKHATFACTPALLRPPQATSLAGLALAGDYTIGAYPATLEAAVASGVTAADIVSRQLNSN